MRLRIIGLEDEIVGWTIEGEGDVADINLEEKKITKTEDDEELPEVNYKKIRALLDFSYGVPSLPLGIPAEIWKGLVCPLLEMKGAIPKRDLIIGRTYRGECRNADRAVWLGSYFEYDRYKFGSCYKEKINHYEDDDGYDLFIPISTVQE